MEPEWGPFRIPPYIIATLDGRQYQIEFDEVRGFSTVRLPDAPPPPRLQLTTEPVRFPDGMVYGRPRPEPEERCSGPCCRERPPAPPPMSPESAATALENATHVLRSLLTDEEWQYFLSHREVDIAGPGGGRYRLQLDRLSGNLRYLPPEGATGRFAGANYWHSGCVHVDQSGRGWIPTGEENVASQVLMIKTNEEEFLRRTIW